MFGRLCLVGPELWNLIDCMGFVGGNMNSASRRFLMILASWALVVSAAFCVLTFSQVASTTRVNYELSGGWWFDGSAFARKRFYVVNGSFTEKKPKRVDDTIDLGDLYVVPPFGDAHTHAFDNPNDIEKVVAANLRDGIFYALSLTNSIRGKRSVAAFEQAEEHGRGVRGRGADRYFGPSHFVSRGHSQPYPLGPTGAALATIAQESHGRG